MKQSLQRPLRRVAGFTAAIGVASLVLAGCAGGTDSADGTTTITFLSWDNEQTMTPVIDAFEAANPDIVVDFSNAPPVQEYISTLQTRILANKAPDVFIMAAENKTNLIDGDFVLDLTDEPFMDAVGEINKATYSADGKVYAMSLASWGGGYLYNADLLAEAGLDGLGDSWDDWLDTLSALKDAGQSAPYLEGISSIPTSLVAQLGASFAAEGGDVDAQIFDGTTTFEEQWTPSLTAWQEMYSSDLVTKDAVTLTNDQIVDEFVNGRVSIMSAGPWDLAPIQEKAPDITLGFVPAGTIEGSPFLVGAASPGYAISAKSERADAAKKFLAFLASPEGVELYQQASNAITTTTDFEPTLDPSLEGIAATVRDGGIYLPMISWPRHQDVLLQEAVAQLQLLAQGQVTPEEVGKAMDAKLASLDS